jgi:hypothetical protein
LKGSSPICREWWDDPTEIIQSSVASAKKFEDVVKKPNETVTFAFSESSWFEVGFG